MAKSTGSGVRKEMVTSKVKEKKNSLDKMDQWMSQDLEQVITCKSQFNITLFNLHKF